MPACVSPGSHTSSPDQSHGPSPPQLLGQTWPESLVVHCQDIRASDRGQLPGRLRGPGVWKRELHRQECACVYMQDCTVRTGASPNCSECWFWPRGAGHPQSHTAQESQVGHRDPSADGIWPSLLPVLFTFSFNSFLYL
ncbi:hypothetical protein mRhiFer1_009277 [Rhinolophus ferrumequinum]|uniref:Uncharacterized protein n=1 Tax=Rhinolophus ferrumequinum TaxID=59479 RepID=A0A7J7RYB2_RHIFE|nr:hypothetical protein mRhiFer1_009277 [Rhinolophus ferrumequinum]